MKKVRPQVAKIVRAFGTRLTAGCRTCLAWHVDLLHGAKARFAAMWKTYKHHVALAPRRRRYGLSLEILESRLVPSHVFNFADTGSLYATEGAGLVSVNVTRSGDTND